MALNWYWRVVTWGFPEMEIKLSRSPLHGNAGGVGKDSNEGVYHKIRSGTSDAL